jgi:thiamine-phosphate pyrophosphorylase
MRGLYAIVDLEALALRGLDRDPLAFAERVLAARPAAIQLRDKTGGAGRTLALLQALAPRCQAAGVPLFANDRPDLALLAGCDGVHVGQDDLPVEMVRALAARHAGGAPRAPLRVGLSTHDASQVEAALHEALDYVAIGPIFPTASKDRPSPVVGLDGLRALCARVRAARPGLPIVAIGGITLENAAAVGAIADAAAVIGALCPQGDTSLDGVTARATALHTAILGGSTR